MNLIRAAFWFALFIASTFCFLVIFERGFKNFGENSRKEVEFLKKVFVPSGKKNTAVPPK